MCGRTACTLNGKCIQGAASLYTNKNTLPKWIDLHHGKQYEPNYNMSPGQITPVLVMEDTVYSNEQADCDVVICPMQWGLIPGWYKGELQDFSLKTNNSRYEGILEKPTFKGSLKAGRRCVILADGYFEWKALSNGMKQPYFIFFPQKNGIDMCTRNWKQDDELLSSENGWKGPRLLTMAGVFDIWQSRENTKIYSYSIITMKSSKCVSSIHHRMPAVLDGESQVHAWLDSRNVSSEKALSILDSIENLEMFPVSTEVNNSRNNTVNCVLPLSKEKVLTEYSPRATALTSWLKISPRQKNTGPKEKRIKL